MDRFLTVFTFQKRIVLSSEPVAIQPPSGVQARVEIPARCPSKTWMSLPLAVSQTLTAASAPVVQSQFTSHVVARS